MDPEGGMFFMRIEFDLHEFGGTPELEQDFASTAERFRMKFRASAAKRKKLAIFVSKEDHCLLELLWHWQAGDLKADIEMVISNHDI